MNHSPGRVKALFKSIRAAAKQDLVYPVMIELDESQLINWADRHWLKSMLADAGINIGIDAEGWSIRHLVLLGKLPKRKVMKPEDA